MKERPDLLTEDSPEGLEVYQLTQETVPSCHIYMEAQIFAPDSSRFLLHRSARPHGSDSADPEHQYLLCECESGNLTPVTWELGATSPSVSPDGRYFYYFITQSGQYSTQLGEKVTLRRRNLDGGEPVDILTLDGCIPGTRFKPSRLYPLSTISSDGMRLAISCFLGDGTTEGGPWGLWVIDLSTGESWLPVVGPTWTNMHPQYCRSRDAAFSHDILIQENHGVFMDANGKQKSPHSRLADIHVVRDDGQHFRSLPWGRTSTEGIQGHQCWRGRSNWAITSTNTRFKNPDRQEGWLLESQALPFTDHLGAEMEGIRNRLCVGEERKWFSHFATDESGSQLIADCLVYPGEDATGNGDTKARDAIYLMSLGRPGKESALKKRFLLSPKISWLAGNHAHPFLSPDGRTAFFNSDESGTMQAYMIRNLPAGHCLQ